MLFSATRLVRLVLLTLALLPLPRAWAAGPASFPGLNRKWVRYQSPNFELYSANSDRESRDALEKMELLRAVFLDTFKLSVRLPQPVTIFYFSRENDFKGYLPTRLRGGTVDWAGFCLNDLDRTVITLAPARDQDNSREVVYHEYIHYLFRVAEQNPAPWFNEAVAELYSTMREDGKWLVLGDPVVGRVLDLRQGRMLPFEQLFAVTYDSPLFRDSGHTGIFYAQSWAFLHYCRFGDNKISPEKLSLFLRVAGSPRIQEKPAQFRALTKELLGYDYPDLLEELRRYIKYGYFRGRRVPRPEIAPKASYAARPAPVEEMTARLAELSLRYTQAGQAELTIRELLGRQPDARLRELLGAMALQGDEPALARDHLSTAVDLGSTNPAVFRELARLEANLVFSQFDLYYRLPDERAARLRSLLEKSLAAAPDQSTGYEMLAWVEATASRPGIANVNLVQRHIDSVNDRPRTVLALVLVRMHLGATKDALALLDQLDQMDRSDWVRYGAELTRAKLEQREVNPANLPAPAKPKGPGISGGSLDVPR